MASSLSVADTVTLRFTLAWDMQLDPVNEKRPFAHLFLSTVYAQQVHQVELEQAKGQMKLSLAFSSPTLRTISPTDLVNNCDLNIHLFARTFNNYQEAVQNPAGSLLIPLHEIVHALVVAGGDRALEKPIELFMVHEVNLNTKGTIRITPATLQVSRVVPIPVLQLREEVITGKHYVKAAVQHSIDRVRKMQAITAHYIETTQHLYERVRPTIHQVRNINSVVWDSNAGSFPPIFYTMDVVEPVFTEAFFSNCLDIVMERSKLGAAQVNGWNVTGDRPNKEDVINMANLCGQVLCAYVIHCAYR